MKTVLMLLLFIGAIFHFDGAQAANTVIFRPNFNPLTAAKGSFEERLDQTLRGDYIQGTWLKEDGYYLLPIDKLPMTGLILQNNLALKIQADAFAVIDELIEKHKDDSLVQLKDSMHTVLVLSSPYGNFVSHENPGNAREFAISIPGKQLIIFNEPNIGWINSYDFGKFMVLHEYFGALGYDDINYNSTLKVWQLLESAPDVTVQDLKDSMGTGFSGPRESIDANSGNNGTGTIVSHGGDFNQLIFKLSLLSSAKLSMALPVDPALVNKFAPSLKQMEDAIVKADIYFVEEPFLDENGLCRIATNGIFKACGSAGPIPTNNNNFLIMISDKWSSDAVKGQGHHLIELILIDFYLFLTDMNQYPGGVR